MSSFSFDHGPFLIAGPCMIESETTVFAVADALTRLRDRTGMPVCFKASFDKANRAGVSSARGPGMSEGLKMLAAVRERTGLPVLTDVHEVHQVAPVAATVNVLQIPAFLARQTDLLVAAGATGLPVNIKKGQWMSPEAMAGAVDKVRTGSGHEVPVAVTERGTFFGYGDLVVDFRSISRMRAATGVPVIYDASHSVQQPGTAAGGASGGSRELIPDLLFAAAAAGADGFFIETHPDPANAMSDAATQWPLDQLDDLVDATLRIVTARREGGR